MATCMQFEDFKNLMNEYLDDFFEDWKMQNKQDPSLFPFELPSFSDWEEQFMFFLESNLTLGFLPK